MNEERRTKHKLDIPSHPSKTTKRQKHAARTEPKSKKAKLSSSDTAANSTAENVTAVRTDDTSLVNVAPIADETVEATTETVAGNDEDTAPQSKEDVLQLIIHNEKGIEVEPLNVKP